MELNQCINFMITSTQSAVFNYFKTCLQPLDITPVQYATLKCLWDQDMQTPTQLAQALNLDTSSVTGILSRMEKKELLERVYCKEDRRCIYVHILASGLALKKDIEAIITSSNETILEKIDEKDYGIFKDVLSKIEQNAKYALQK